MTSPAAVAPQRVAATRAPTWTGVWVASANALVTLSALALSREFEWIRLTGFLSLCALAFLVARHLGNIFFLARTIILGGIGYFPIAVKIYAGSDALFSAYEPSTQTLDIAIVMYVSTTLALLSSEVGFLLGTRRGIVATDAAIARSRPFWRTAFWLAIPAVLWASFVTIRSAPSVLAAVYATEATGQLLGNTQNIGVIALLTMFVARARAPMPMSAVTFLGVALLFVVWALFFRGLRQDVVSTALGLAVCAALVQNREPAVRPRTLIVTIVLVAVVEFMGVARGLLAAGLSTSEIWTIFVQGFAPTNTGIYHIGTVSAIASTFANTVHLVDTGRVALLHGQSFAEFIPRTLPEFIYPDRPKDYALMFPQYGLSTGGGIFEIAEAYLNFGLIGAAIVPGAISYLMARAFYRALQRQAPLDYFALFAFLGMFMRGTWYQIFAFYKSWVTAMILFALFVVSHKILRAASHASGSAESLGERLVPSGRSAS